MNAVEFRQVNFQIGDREILKDLSLTVEPGETLVLLGRSGSGKTTALRLINGMIMPTSGQVSVDGKTTGEWDLVRLRRGIGYVIQEGGLFPHFTIERNVGLVPRLEGWPEERIAPRVKEVLESVSLSGDEYMQRYPAELSGGQRQRAGVARALAGDPKILLFDEPFGALDPVTRLELQNEFLRLRDRLADPSQRKTSVFVTHDVREAMKLASRIALLHEGTLAFIGPPEEFQQSAHPEARAFVEVLRA
ncbi:MAG TPA: ATP-binding cassette domain-containing protein [Bryobacteraceae bacterium]|jgi:osmoprotectant transport system ATP-binding protein|nr:ATP-binding cassette domain-containing protein [Bryobacteraceae bacterium]